jgi:hypothetical protein
MRLMNDILCDFIVRFVVVYFDDILIYSKNLDEHVEHLRNVLDVLIEECLYANMKVCDFCMEKIIFLGYVVSLKSIEMDGGKARVIQEWPTFMSIIEVRSFQGLISSYWRFVKDFSTLIAFLTKIIKNSIGFKWGKKQENGFNLLKEKLISTPLLSLSKFTKTFEIECRDRY